MTKKPPNLMLWLLVPIICVVVLIQSIRESIGAGTPKSFLVALGLIVTNVALAAIFWSRAQRTDLPETTGRALEPRVSNLDRQQTSWIGGVNLRGSLGRMNATFPFGFLDVSESAMVLRVRPGVSGAVFGVSEVRTTPAHVRLVFPVRTRTGGKGIGVQLQDENVAYFWTRQREAVLGAIQAAGFTTSWEERRAHWF